MINDGARCGREPPGAPMAIVGEVILKRVFFGLKACPDIGDLDPEVHLVVGVNRPLGIQPKAYILDFIVLLVYRTTLEGTVGLSTVSLSPGAGETATRPTATGRP